MSKTPICYLTALLLGLLAGVTLPAQEQRGGLETAFAQTEALFKRAIEQQAPFWSPQLYQGAEAKWNEAALAWKKGQPSRPVLALLREAQRQLAAGQESARRTQQWLDPVWQDRQAARELGCAPTTSNAFADGEKDLQSAIRLAESRQEAELDDELKALSARARTRFREAAAQTVLDGALRKLEQELTLKRWSMEDKIYLQASERLAALQKEVRSWPREENALAFLIEKYLEKYKDIGGIIIPLQPRPDTLDMGGFVIVVERYDKLGAFNFFTQTFTGLEGIGRIQFSCPKPPFTPLPPSWSDLVLKPYPLTVVERVRDPNLEIALPDAQRVDAAAKAGSQLQLLLPDKAQWQTEIADYLDYLYPKVKGIRVRFSGVTAAASLFSKRGQVLSGQATYPTQPPIPEPPIQLSLSGFTLFIDSLTLSPSAMRAQAELQLPTTLASGDSCRAVVLPLGEITISADCEFYKAVPDSTYGPAAIGNTGIAVAGKGYIADFHSLLRYFPLGAANSWKGVILLDGSSPGAPPGTATSNTGYTQASYTYPMASVTGAGFSGLLRCEKGYAFNFIQPYGYSTRFSSALLNIQNNRIAGGELKEGKLQLPKEAVRDDAGNALAAGYTRLEIRPGGSLFGEVRLLSDHLTWGEYVETAGGPLRAYGARELRLGYAFFSAELRPNYFPLFVDDFVDPTLYPVASQMEALGMQGAVWGLFDWLQIHSPDVPPGYGPLEFRVVTANKQAWINVVSRGVHAGINIYREVQEEDELGPTDSPHYVGNQAFQTRFGPINDQWSKPFLSLRFVESAVHGSDISGHIRLEAGIQDDLPFKQMAFTSTAHNAGAQVDLSTPIAFQHWGLQLVQQAGFSSAGFVSVKSGQVILTAAGLSEPRHFAEPFWLTWGEILADGNIGRLFFDYNAAGQAFDGFGFTPHAVALSSFAPASNGYLQAGGMVHLPFFGPDYMHIWDHYDPTMPAAPFNNRRIELSSNSGNGFEPTDFDIYGNWSGGLGLFDFTLAYSTVDQDGFTGMGTSRMEPLTGGTLASTLIMKASGTCIQMRTSGSEYRGVALGPVANLSQITRLWGCICFEGDVIESAVLGGEVTTAANLSIAARTGASLSATMKISPSVTQFSLDGEAYLSLTGPTGIGGSSVDLVVTGHFFMKVDRAAGFIEGEINGMFRAASGTVSVIPPLFFGNSLEAHGEANWHLGADYQSIQGALAVSLIGLSSTSLGAGFYASHNAPKSKAWVLMGADPRYKLNMTALPNKLSGVYGFLRYGHGVNLYILSGGYEVYLGFGGFLLDAAQVADLNAEPTDIPISFFVVGNMYGRIWGEVLGGLVSGSAYLNLQIIGPVPFGFEGTVGVEGCALWVFCGTVDVTVGLNQVEGFYLR